MKIDIFDTRYQINIVGSIVFEAKSFVGRVLKLNKCPEDGSKLLHLGCGMNYFPEFVNADFYGGFKFWKKKRRPDWMLDMRYRLECENDRWDGVFSEHVLEHLYFDEALRLLKEIYRVTKKGGYVRIVVPDAESIAREYLEDRSDLSLGVRLIWGLTQTWGHRSVWDDVLLSDFLKQAGFSKVSRVKFGEGDAVNLIKDSSERKLHSLYIEAQK